MFEPMIALFCASGFAWGRPAAWFTRPPRVVGERAELVLEDGRVDVALVGAQVSSDHHAKVSVQGWSRVGIEVVEDLEVSVRWTRMGPRYLRVARVPEVQMGSITLRDLRVEVVDGDEVVLGVAHLGVGAVVRSATRTLTLGPADEMLGMVGPPTVVEDGTLPGSIGGRTGRVRLDSATRFSSLAVDLDAAPHVERGIHWYEATIGLGGEGSGRSVWLIRDESLPDGTGLVGVVGRDVLDHYDIAVAGHRIALMVAGDGPEPPGAPPSPPAEEVACEAAWCEAWSAAQDHLAAQAWGLAEGQLRQAIHLGARTDPDVRLALSWAEAKQGRDGIGPLVDRFVVEEEDAPGFAREAHRIAEEIRPGYGDAVLAEFRATNPRVHWMPEAQ